MTFRLIRALAAVMLACVAAAAFAAVEVNTATASDLDGIRGIGPAIAGRIVAERARGPYKDWQDLVSRVKGVGEKTAAEFSTGGLTVNGAAFAGAPAATPTTKGTARIPSAAPAPSVAPTPATTPPAAPASTSTSAADRKAAAKAARDEKKAARAAAVAQARQDRMAKPPGAASAASGATR